LKNGGTVGREYEGGFEAFEREVRRRFNEAEREFLGEELARLDVTLPEVVIDGIVHRPVVTAVGEYMTAAGPVKVLRHRYRAVGTNGASECPLELRAGIVEGLFTPLAARMGVWAMTHLTSLESENLFRELGGMHPSRSTLDRLPKGISERWEMRRREWESELQAQEAAVSEVAVIGVSLDGVMAPMKDGQRETKREQSRQKGKQVSGPAGYREVGCGTVSLYDAKGERLRTVRFARMPEPKKGVLKRQLAAEVEHALKQYPHVPLVKVADGARDNWTFLSKELPEGIEVVDFYHAAEHPGLMIGRFELRGALGILQRLGILAAPAVRGGERLVGDAVLRVQFERAVQREQRFLCLAECQPRLRQRDPVVGVPAVERDDPFVGPFGLRPVATLVGDAGQYATRRRGLRIGLRAGACRPFRRLAEATGALPQFGQHDHAHGHLRIQLQGPLEGLRGFRVTPGAPQDQAEVVPGLGLRRIDRQRLAERLLRLAVATGLLLAGADGVPHLASSDWPRSLMAASSRPAAAPSPRSASACASLRRRPSDSGARRAATR
jgi:hypothetical protein